ncbi:MAG: hypothetical protein Q8N90_01320 [bacterium]|nr:hypothetical protein [bacterium]
MRKKDRGWLITALACAVICVVGCVILITTVNQPERFNLLRQIVTDANVIFMIVGALCFSVYLFGNKS